MEVSRNVLAVSSLRLRIGRLVAEDLDLEQLSIWTRTLSIAAELIFVRRTDHDDWYQVVTGSRSMWSTDDNHHSQLIWAHSLFGTVPPRAWMAASCKLWHSARHRLCERCRTAWEVVGEALLPDHSRKEWCKRSWKRSDWLFATQECGIGGECNALEVVIWRFCLDVFAPHQT